jgi:hypothetical protein
MKPLSLLAVSLILSLAACGATDAGPVGVSSLTACGTAAGDPFAGAGLADLSSVAGEYALVAVGGVDLPCGVTDSLLSVGQVEIRSGDTGMMLVSGTLLLDSLPPDTMIPVPSSVVTARSCVHVIPNGAYESPGGIVHMPDGSSYVIPPCGASFSLSLRYRYTLPDGSAGDLTKSSTGRYVWGSDGRAELLRVFGAPIGSGGTIASSAGGIQLRISPIWGFEGPGGPEYRFSLPR